MVVKAEVVEEGVMMEEDILQAKVTERVEIREEAKEAIKESRIVKREYRKSLIMKA